MKKEECIKDKAKRLARRARLPRTLNRYGPKDHPMWLFFLAHLVKTVHAPTWRRVAKFMRDFFDVDLHWTTWQKAVGKWPEWVWAALGRASAGDDPCEVAAVDGTTFTRSDPSHHYLKRIDRDHPVGRPVQEVVMIDVIRRKFLAWRFRATPRGEKCDVPYLVRHSPTLPELLLMDKGFDSNPLHTWLRNAGIWSVAPVRKGCKRGNYRRQMRDCFDWALYWQRSIIECMFSAIKRLFGTHVRARSARMQRTEISCRFIAYNLGCIITTTFYRASIAKRFIYHTW